MEKTKFTVKVLALAAIVPLLVFAEMRHTKKETKKGPHGIIYEASVAVPVYQSTDQPVDKLT